MVAAQLMDQLVKTQAERNALRHEIADLRASRALTIATEPINTIINQHVKSITSTLLSVQLTPHHNNAL